LRIPRTQLLMSAQFLRMPLMSAVTDRPAGSLTVTLVAGMALGLASPLFAQHEVTPADIDEGGRLFQASCTSCHGAEGDAVFGVDLGRGQFRQAVTDMDLIRVIRTGVPEKGMPPSTFSEEQASTIVVYLRSLVSTPASMVPGDAPRGRMLFEGKGACATCHRVNGNGSRLGPDLSDIGQLRRAGELERSLVEPNAEILPPNRPFRVVARDGTTTTGRLLNHDSFIVQMLDSQQQLRSFTKATLREYAFVDKSPMPSARDSLSSEEIVDVIRYLVSLTGVKASAPRD
jgi:putative heme-binding domain-containing protein